MEGERETQKETKRGDRGLGVGGFYRGLAKSWMSSKKMTSSVIAASLVFDYCRNMANHRSSASDVILAHREGLDSNSHATKFNFSTTGHF